MNRRLKTGGRRQRPMTAVVKGAAAEALKDFFGRAQRQKTIPIDSDFILVSVSYFLVVAPMVSSFLASSFRFGRQLVDPRAERSASGSADDSLQLALVHPHAAALAAAIQREHK